MKDKAILNHKIYGKGEPVLILHGLLGMMENWHSFARLLSRKFKVILADQRNHGHSFHSPDHNYHLMAEDVNNLCESLGLDSLHLIGHSMGAKTALQFIKEYPERARKVVCVDMAPGQNRAAHELIFRSLLAIRPEELKNRRSAFKQLKKDLESDVVVHFLLKNLDRTGKKGYEWKANINSLWNNYSHIMEPIKRESVYNDEILFVRGENSDYITEMEIEEIKKDYPNYQLHTISGAGHWVHADNPDELLRVILDFLNK